MRHRQDQQVMAVLADLHCHVKIMDHKLDAILKAQGEAITPEDRAALDAATQQLKSSAANLSSSVSENTPKV